MAKADLDGGKPMKAGGGTRDVPADRPAPARAAGGSRRARKGPLRVLVVRHAVAEDWAEFAGRTGGPDADRPLTDEGRRKFRDAARGIVELVPELGVLATSPLVRATETAELLARRYAKAGREPDAVQLSALAPGKASSLLLGWLSDQPRGAPVAVVGHEPHLGQFVSWALTGLRDSFVEFKKGGACLLEFDEDVRPGRAKLLWSLRPGQLRAIGRAGMEE